MKRSFGFLVVIGILVIWLSYLISSPVYYQQQAKMQVIGWIIDFEKSDLAKQIENQLLTNQPVKVNANDLKIRYVKSLRVNALGEVVLKGNQFGQIIILTPIKQNNKITWQCFGGSNKDIPSKCRGNQ